MNAPETDTAKITRLEKELVIARASANHQRKKKSASNVARNRAVQGVEHWKARAQSAETRLLEVKGVLERIVALRLSRPEFVTGGPALALRRLIAASLEAREALTLLEGDGG